MDTNFKENKLNLVAKASLDAINWLEKVQDNKIKAQSNDLEVDLARLYINSRAAFDVLPTMTTIGIFGASQVGKSYLVSTLATHGGGKEIETYWDGKKVNFITDINPSGHGNEATGLVTRFTYSDYKTPKGFPVLIKVFTEIEIVKILVNSYFLDIDFNSEYQSEHDAIFKDSKRLLEELSKLDAPKYQLTDDEKNYVTGADLVDLASYVQSHAKGVLADCDFSPKSDFWTIARKKIEKLNFQGRFAFYSLLWHHMPAFDNLFNVIATQTQKFKGKTKLYAPINAFMNLDNGGAKATKVHNIVDIESLKQLFDLENDYIKVSLDEEGTDITKIPFANLAFSTIEITFKLEKTESKGNFDILDFPGARSRKLEDLNVWNKADSLGNQGGSKDATEFIRRGKVGFLIERYIERREIDVLLFCEKVSGQSDVPEVNTYITNWVNQNIGRTPKERSGKKKSLVGAFTRFDACITAEKNNLSSSSSIHKTLEVALEHYNSEWMNDWADNEPFNQFFCVRKPNIPESDNLYEVKHLDNKQCEEIKLKDDEDTKRLIDDYKNQIIIKQDYLKHLYEFSKYADKKEIPTLSEVLRPNDGGVSYLSNFLVNEFDDFTDNKVDTLGKITILCNNLRSKTRLGAFANEAGNAASKENRKEAVSHLKELIQVNNLTGIISKLREFLELDLDEAISDYRANRSDGISNNAHRFAQALTKMWKSNLERLSSFDGDSFKVLAYDLEHAYDEKRINEYKAFSDEKLKNDYSFFIDENGDVIENFAVLKIKLNELLKFFTSEMIKSYKVLGVEQAIINKLEPYEKDITTKENLSLGQANRAIRIISDFNTYLTLGDTQGNKVERCFNTLKDNTENAKDRALFQEFSVPEEGENLPRITQDIVDCAVSHFNNDYFSVLVDLIVNRNQSVGSEYNLTKEENDEICDILKSFDDNLLSK